MPAIARLLHARTVAPLPAPQQRDVSSTSDTLDLTMTVLGLIFVSLLIVTALVLLRRIHARRAHFIAQHGNADISALPPYHNAQAMGAAMQEQQRPVHNPFLPTSQAPRNTRGLTIHTTDAQGRETHCALVFGSDGQPMLANPNSPPHSPDNAPAIHITFPDEVDDDKGSIKGGRVVVVRVGDSGVGLEPLHHDDQLPAYERDSKDAFYSVDMDQIGGLKEKDRTGYY
jgi:hypothetical protein